MHVTPARPRPASNLELYSWFFMRITAVALFAMAVFHLVYMHIIVGLDLSLIHISEPTRPY